jgi:hypothetical protein
MINRTCPECNSVEFFPSGAFDVTVDGGSKYPDVLGCGAYPFLFLSERVISAFIEGKIAAFHTFEVGVTKVISTKLRDIQPPKYYRVEIDGACEIDLLASGLKISRLSSNCHHLVTDPMLANGFVMKSGSWDGSPLFRDPVLYPRVNFCTQSLLELAYQYQFSNFRFEPMEGPRNSARKGIDYLNGHFG